MTSSQDAFPLEKGVPSMWPWTLGRLHSPDPCIPLQSALGVESWTSLSCNPQKSQMSLGDLWLEVSVKWVILTSRLMVFLAVPQETRSEDRAGEITLLCNHQLMAI